MEKSITETKFINYMYVISEMIEDMKQTISKVQSIVESQTKLIAYLEKSEDKKLFEEFINSLKTANEQYDSQVKVLKHRLECALEVQTACESLVEVRKIVSLLLETFGVANKEAKSIEERIDNKETVEYSA